MKLKWIIEGVIFNSKWLLLPFYFVLILALAVYTYFDVAEFVHYVSHLKQIDKSAAMLTFIELVDMMMIANLGKQLVTGSYNSFISKDHGYEGENITSGMLKVKMATSLVGITSIALLERSIRIDGTAWETLHKLVYVHVTFLLSAIILAVIDYLHCKAEH